MCGVFVSEFVHTLSPDARPKGMMYSELSDGTLLLEIAQMKMKKGKNLTKGLGVQPREKTTPPIPHTSKNKHVCVYKQVHHRLRYYLYRIPRIYKKGEGIVRLLL